MRQTVSILTWRVSVCAAGAAGGWAAVNDMAGAAEQARMELMLWQALNRSASGLYPLILQQDFIRS